jgi:hypothetical protein
MATSLDDCIDKAETALGKINALETAAMRKGDIATMNALQGDSNMLNLRLTQLQALRIQATIADIEALGKQLDGVTASADQALSGLAQIATVLTGILAVTKTLDGLIAIGVKAANT